MVISRYCWMRHSIYRKLQDSSKNTVVMSFVPSDGHLLQCVFDQNILLSDVHLTEYSIAYILWRSICQTGCCQKVLCVRHTIVFKLVWTAWLDGCNGWMHVIFFFFFSFHFWHSSSHHAKELFKSWTVIALNLCFWQDFCRDYCH